MFNRPKLLSWSTIALSYVQFPTISAVKIFFFFNLSVYRQNSHLSQTIRNILSSSGENINKKMKWTFGMQQKGACGIALVNDFTNLQT